MGDPSNSKEAWRTIEAAYDDLAGARRHRALGRHRCSCGDEFVDAPDLTTHIKEAEGSAAPE